MIYNISTGPLSEEEQKVRDFLKEKKYKRVLDIGGVQRPWARPYVTHYMDPLDPNVWAKRYPEMIDYEGFWYRKFIQSALTPRLVEKFSSKVVDIFDFIICSQTLEHVSNPELFLIGLTRIGFQGFISIPHKLFELKKGIHWDQPFRGALPHRWISVIRNETLIMYPKLNFIEYMKFKCDEKNDTIPDLSFWWKTNIPHTIVDDSKIDFPDPQEAINFYQQELDMDGIYG